MWRERLRPLLAQHLTNENRSKVAMLGVGCFYVYFNGCWIYMKMRSAKFPGDYRLDGPFPQMFTSEMLSHFSPYILPSYVKGGCMSGILRDISTDSRDFRDRLITYISIACRTYRSPSYRFIQDFAKSHMRKESFPRDGRFWSNYEGYYRT